MQQQGRGEERRNDGQGRHLAERKRRACNKQTKLFTPLVVQRKQKVKKECLLPHLAVFCVFVCVYVGFFCQVSIHTKNAA